MGREERLYTSWMLSLYFFCHFGTNVAPRSSVGVPPAVARAPCPRVAGETPPTAGGTLALRNRLITHMARMAY